MPISTEELTNPEKLEETIWRLLARAAVDSRHAFKLFGIATVTVDGMPDARTVVLRACDIAAKELYFHTDIRSGKIAHLKNQPEVCMLFWDPRNSLQLRIYGKAFVHHLDEVTREKIAVLPPQQMALYGFAQKPGTILEQVRQAAYQDDLVEQHFAWVRVCVHTIDALHLGRNGVHTRVHFDFRGGGGATAVYLQA